MSFLKKLNRKAGILAPHIENYFALGQFPDEIPFVVNPNKESDDAFHPSGDGLECLLTLYMKAQGRLPREKHSGELQKTFIIGHMYHGLLQHVIVHGLGFATEDAIEHEARFTTANQPLPITPLGTWQDCPEIQAAKALGEWWMRGSADVSSCVIPAEGDFLVDIKTAASFSFKKAAGEVTKFSAKYEAQAQLYMDWHNKERAIVLYQNKDSPHDFKEWIIERDKSFVTEIYDRWRFVADCLATGIQPECDCGPDAFCSGTKALRAEMSKATA